MLVWLKDFQRTVIILMQKSFLKKSNDFLESNEETKALG